ncbi:MAG: acyltransferase family protein [Akkermansia sp.]
MTTNQHNTCINNPEKLQRYEVLDTCRTLAIVLIILHHTTAWGGYLPGFQTDHNILFLPIFTFFFLSGFFYKRGNFLNCIKKYVIPYLIWCCFYGILKIFLPHSGILEDFPPYFIEFIPWVLSGLGITSIVPQFQVNFWFVKYLIIMIVIAWFVRPNTWRKQIFFILPLLCLIIYSPQFSEIFQGDKIFQYRAIIGFIFFLAGIYFGLNKSGFINRLNKWTLFWLILSGLGFYLTALAGQICATRNFFAQFNSIVFLLVLSSFLKQYLPSFSLFLSKLGKLAFLAYAIHPLSIHIIRQGFPPHIFEYIAWTIPIITFTAAWLMDAVIRRWTPSLLPALCMSK